jgi:hypothetical protein
MVLLKEFVVGMFHPTNVIISSDGCGEELPASMHGEFYDLA